MQLGECKVCGEQAYFRGKDSDWRITFAEPTEPNTSTWVHKEWTKHAQPGESPKEYEKFGKLPPYDHDAEPKVFTHTLIIEVDSYLASSQDVHLLVANSTALEPFRPKLVGQCIPGRTTQ